MTGERALSFVDTTVLVYAFDKSGSPKKRVAVGLADQAKLSFWDAQVVVAAARTGAAVLYTEDLNHGQEILGVRISNPFISAPLR
jgi:predicted nucleic acid-binding protein